MDNTTLKSCITKTLSLNFKECSIYKNKPSQVKLPAFFVRYIDVSQNGQGMGFYQQNYIVEIKYRPRELMTNDVSTHLDSIAEQVIDLIVEIYGDDFFSRALNINYEIIDETLLIIANYQVRKRIIKEEVIYMKNLIEKKEVK